MAKGTNRPAIRLVFTIISVMACLVASNAYAQQIVGSVTELSGSAQIQRAGATIAVVQGISVELHDRLVTSVGSSATVRLTSGTTLTLGEHTNLTFDQNVTASGTGRTLLDLPEGGLRTIV